MLQASKFPLEILFCLMETCSGSDYKGDYRYENKNIVRWVNEPNSFLSATSDLLTLHWNSYSWMYSTFLLGVLSLFNAQDTNILWLYSQQNSLSTVFFLVSLFLQSFKLTESKTQYLSLSLHILNSFGHLLQSHGFKYLTEGENYTMYIFTQLHNVYFLYFLMYIF